MLYAAILNSVLQQCKFSSWNIATRTQFDFIFLASENHISKESWFVCSTSGKRIFHFHCGIYTYRFYRTWFFALFQPARVFHISVTAGVVKHWCRLIDACAQVLFRGKSQWDVQYVWVINPVLWDKRQIRVSVCFSLCIVLVCMSAWVCLYVMYICMWNRLTHAYESMATNRVIC